MMKKNEFIVIADKKVLYSSDMDGCINYIKNIDAKNDTYYHIANAKEYYHINNIERMYNSYYTRYNNEFYDFREICIKNTISLLEYMDGLQISKVKEYKKISLFDL